MKVIKWWHHCNPNEIYCFEFFECCDLFIHTDILTYFTYSRWCLTYHSKFMLNFILCVQLIFRICICRQSGIVLFIYSFFHYFHGYDLMYWIENPQLSHLTFTLKLVNFIVVFEKQLLQNKPTHLIFWNRSAIIKSRSKDFN